MKVARIPNFGGPEVIVLEDVPVPVAASGEVLVQVAAAGVGPWDALIRRQKQGESAVTTVLKRPGQCSWPPQIQLR